MSKTTTKLTPAKRAQQLRDQVAQWDMVQEAFDQQRSPTRNRIVVKCGVEYFSTHRYEINPDNGYATVQLRDGSVLPTRLGNWCIDYVTESHFEIPQSEVKIDDFLG